jgi:CheY-like chemotaxis protein
MTRNLLTHVLLIENRLDIATLIADELSDLGCSSYDSVTTESEAIRIAAARPPNLIIADENLEQGSGSAAVEAICSERRIATVFITADPAPAMRHSGHAILLKKPFSSAALVDAIDRALSAASSRNRAEERASRSQDHWK